MRHMVTNVRCSQAGQAGSGECRTAWRGLCRAARMAEAPGWAGARTHARDAGPADTGSRGKWKPCGKEAHHHHHHLPSPRRKVPHTRTHTHRDNTHTGAGTPCRSHPKPAWRCGAQAAAAATSCCWRARRAACRAARGRDKERRGMQPVTCVCFACVAYETAAANRLLRCASTPSTAAPSAACICREVANTHACADAR